MAMVLVQVSSDYVDYIDSHCILLFPMFDGLVPSRARPNVKAICECLHTRAPFPSPPLLHNISQVPFLSFPRSLPLCPLGCSILLIISLSIVLHCPKNISTHPHPLSLNSFSILRENNCKLKQLTSLND